MKKLILFIAFILSVNLLFAQEREVDATVVIVRDSVIMTDGKVTDMAPGTALKDAVNTSQLTDTINKYAFVQPIDSLFFDRDAAITGHNPYKVDVDTTNGTLRMYNDEVDIAMQMGQELWIKVKNNNGSTFDDGIIVYISGSETGFPVVSIAHNRDFETCDAIGMLTHDVEAATFGYLTTYGTVGGLDTSGETEGARVYVDTLNGGKNWTTTIPEFAEFQYEIGFIHTADPTEGKIFINPKGQLDDIMHNINNANILENFDFRCASDGATISGILNSTDGKDYLTVRWSDGFSKISVPDTVTIPQGTDNNSQTAYIYIPKSTEVLTTSTSYFPIGTQYKTIAKTNAWSAARTQTVGLKGNQNYNDYVASITSLRGRIAQIGNWQRLRNLKYINGSNGTVTVRTGVAIPDTVTFAVTQGNWSQVNEQVLLAMDMYTGDSIHVLNYLSHADTAVIDLNELLVDANGTSLSGKSFTFVFWISQNKTGEPSHMWVNLPNGSYSSGAEAEADVNNYKVTEIPYNMRSYSGFVTEVVLTHTNPSGGTWSVYSTSNIQGNEPGYSGGGAGGPTGGTIDGLSDTPSGKGGSANKIFAVDNLEANLEYKDVTIDASGNMVAAGTITSPNFISNVAIGTQSYAGISTTLNINLNADLLDGVQGANYFNKLTDDTDDITEGSNLFNQTHTGEVSGSIALTIANNIIDEPNLKVTNTPTDDFLLSYDIGTLGFTWVPPFGDVSFSDTVSIIATKYDIDTVSISVALNTTHRTSNGTDHSYIDQSVISGATPTFTNANFTEATDKNYVTDAEAVVIGNTSGTNSGDVTLNASATTGGMSIVSQEISNRAATNAQTGYATATHISNIETNNAKVTNVTTNLNLGTVTATTMDVNSSDGTNATLISADTDDAGLLTADKWDEIIANTSARHAAVTIGTPANGLSLSTQEISIGLASTSTIGALSDTDWDTFNTDTSVSNEGSLDVGAGTDSTSVITSNTSGSPNITFKEGENIILTESADTIIITAAGGGTIDTIQITQSSHGFSVGDWIYNNGTIFALGLANASTTAGVVGVVMDSIDVNTFAYQWDGVLSGSYTEGSAYFLSTGVAGTDTLEPTYSIGEIRQGLGTGVPSGLQLLITEGEEISEFSAGDTVSISTLTPLLVDSNTYNVNGYVTLTRLDEVIDSVSAVSFVIESDPSPISSPSESEEYYYGAFASSNGLTTFGGTVQLLMPYDCTLVGYSLVTRSGTDASSETSTLSVRINDATDVQLSNAIEWSGTANTAKYYSSTGLSTNFTAGDKFEFKLETPTWTTDPTTVYLTTTLYFRNR